MRINQLLIYINILLISNNTRVAKYIENDPSFQGDQRVTDFKC